MHTSKQATEKSKEIDMSFEITAGWWLLPTLLTLLAWGLAGSYKRYSSRYFNADIEGVFRYGVALIVILTMWLIYALAT